MSVFVATAGWYVSRAQNEFGPGESVLERFSTRLNAVEINSTFKTEHKRATFERWARTVPDEFRFSVKLPKRITHDNRLVDSSEELELFLGTVSGLGEKLGPLLVQLPPKLAFDLKTVDEFFSMLRHAFDGPVVCEPRHPSWGSENALDVLMRYRVGRVAADPETFSGSSEPRGFLGTEYYRLHGSPLMYYSSYSDEYLQACAEKLKASTAAHTWCVFDNTAEGHALPNALRLQHLLKNANSERDNMNLSPIHDTPRSKHL